MLIKLEEMAYHESSLFTDGLPSLVVILYSFMTWFSFFLLTLIFFLFRKDSTELIRQKSVAWIVSRCRSDSKREDFVTELQKYIDVDVYGRCGTLRCTRGNASNSCQAKMKDYHFYLAFENSFCPDYVTEKLYKVLAMEDRPPIPVVLGTLSVTTTVFGYSSTLFICRWR